MQRINDTITGRMERPLLAWLCARLPGWITSDMLTGLGVVGAAISFAGYTLSARAPAFLCLACAGIALNWFGDSLDGSLARYRKAERPKYGFYLDHMTDTFAMALIAIGVGLSPYASLTSGMAVLLGYYVMVILAMVTSHATGVFQISFNGLGPTEIRLFIIACTLCAIALPMPVFDVLGLAMTVYDVIMLTLTGLLVILCLREMARTLRALAIQEPGTRH